MPQVGETVLGRELNKSGFNSKRRYLYHICSSCGRGRWVRLYDKRKTGLCLSCSTRRTRKSLAKNGGNGRKITSYGYVLVAVSPSNPFYPMVDKQGYVREHRLVIAKKLGRLLLSQEKVHHINGIKDDNREENLQLVSAFEHSIYNQLCANCQLRKEIRRLCYRVKELSVIAQGKIL